MPFSSPVRPQIESGAGSEGRRRMLREAKDQATLHDLTAEFSVSAERIRQIEQKALQKMRGVLRAA